MRNLTRRFVVTAVKAPDRADSDGAIVALLDTGSYPTAAGPPVGTAGSQSNGVIMEARRIAEYVLGRRSVPHLGG